MKAAHESPLLAEGLMLPKLPEMNSKLLMQMVSPREKPPHVRHSPSIATVTTDEGTIGTSREKACYKSPFLAHQLLVFFALTRYMVVKIVF
jgi:hypothetical protein